MQILDFTNTRLDWHRPLTSYAKVQQLYSRFVRNMAWQARRPRCHSLGLLNVGCGPFPRAEFINLDYYWMPGIDLCWDAARGIPLPDRWVHGVFCEHMIEHLPLEQARRLLAEFHRVLKPGGVARISVPDAELYLTLYNRRRAGEAARFPYEQSDDATPLLPVNRAFRGHGHMFAYDEETLAHFLREAGFVEVRREGYLRGRDPRLLVDRPERQVESLYVEAAARGGSAGPAAEKRRG